MRRDDFQEIFGEFEKTFGHFSDLKKGRIYHYCQDLNPYDFRALCIRFVDLDHKPGVFDFKVKARVFKDIQSTDFGEINFECEKCDMVGVLKLTDRESGAITFCRCTCINGKKETWNIPFFEKAMTSQYKAAALTKEDMIGERTFEVTRYEEFGAIWKKKVKAAERFWGPSGAIKNA